MVSSEKNIYHIEALEQVQGGKEIGLVLHMSKQNRGEKKGGCIKVARHALSKQVRPP